MRTMSTSMRIAAPRPMPNIFTITSLPMAKARNTEAMISPAIRITLAIRDRPCTTLSDGLSPSKYASRMRDSRKTL